MLQATAPPPLVLAHGLPPASHFHPAALRAMPSPSPAQHEFASLEAWLSAPGTSQLPLDQVEWQQEQKGRELQRLLLEAHIQQRGPGDVGPSLWVTQEGQMPTLYSHRRLHTRVLKTIFGPVSITRMGYCRKGTQSIHPLDETLQLPARSFSYELQKRMVKAAAQGPFREAGERIAEITGAPVPVRSLEEVIQEAAQDFDAFYAERTPPIAADTGSILVAAVDGKGIPMMKTKSEQQPVRRSKGQKANRKKMATVATVFTRAEWVRTPQQVVESLFGPERCPRDENPPPRPEHKRVWASLTKGKAVVIGEVAAEVLRRDPHGDKKHVALTDGERALQILVSQKLQITLILDLLHVLEKIWKAAYVFHAEGSVEAELWVRLRAEKILEGHSSQVVQGIRQTVTKHAFRCGKRKTLTTVANYLHRNRDRMHYDQYLAQGLPIASGPVEGACKNLIKDRMERSGMRWTEAMAEAIVKLRAIYLSGDFDQYWSFHIDKDQQRLYPAGRWTVVEK